MTFTKIFFLDLGFNGFVSSLLSWNRCLTEDEAEQMYKFYKTLLITANSSPSEPVLEPKMLKFLIGNTNNNFDKYLSKPLTLSELITMIK